MHGQVNIYYYSEIVIVFVASELDTNAKAFETQIKFCTNGTTNAHSVANIFSAIITVILDDVGY